MTFAAPEFLSDLARAQGAAVRNLIVLYLSGGNDALSTLVPYNDPFYYSRRGSIAVPAGSVLQIGTDSSGATLGLHPRLTGLRQIFNQGALALIQRTGYDNQSRSHFQGTDIWSTANPSNSTGLGWVGRYLDSLPSPVDPLVGWNTTRDLPRVLQANRVAVPAIPNAAQYSFNSPNTGVGGACRAERRHPHQFARAGRSARGRLRLQQRAGGDGDARSRGARSPPTRHRRLSQHAVRAGAARGRRRDGPRHRNESLLRHDRRFRHALGPGRQSGRTARTTT